MDLSNSILLKKYNLRISKNTKEWYKCVLSYDDDHPQANYAFACDLEQQGELCGAQQHFRKAYQGGYNSAVVGLERVEEKLRHKQQQPVQEIPDKSKWKGIVLLLLVFLVSNLVIYLLSSSEKEQDIYKVYNIREAESKVVEQEVWVHRLPVTPGDASLYAKDRKVYDISLGASADVKEMIVRCEEYATKNNLTADSPFELVVYYANPSGDRAGQLVSGLDPIAKVSLMEGRVKDIYLFPGFKKKVLI